MKKNHVVFWTLRFIFIFTFFPSLSFGLTDSEVISRFSEIYNGAKVDRLEKGPLAGLYEVTVKDSVIYFQPESGLVFIGDVLDKKRINLTAEKRKAIMIRRLEALPLATAVKIGNGPKKVIEFSDPDCPFCRKTFQFFKDRKDVTRFVFLFPVEELHPRAKAKSLYILCADDKAKAYKEILSGGLDVGVIPICTDSNVAKVLDEHIAIARSLGVTGTPFLGIMGETIQGADMDRIALLLETQKIDQH